MSQWPAFKHNKIIIRKEETTKILGKQLQFNIHDFAKIFPEFSLQHHVSGTNNDRDGLLIISHWLIMTSNLVLNPVKYSMIL